MATISTSTQSFPSTFEEYLDYDDGTDNCYELVDGALVLMPPESEFNLFLAQFLARQLDTCVPWRQIKLQKLELAVPAFPGMSLNRQPDLMVIRPEQISQMKRLGKAVITLAMSPPLFVAEVVSPYRNRTQDNYRRDYLDKRKQYEARGIPEYWIIDPTVQQVTLLVLREGQYRETIFEGDRALVSEVFPDLNLSAAQVLSP